MINKPSVVCVKQKPFFLPFGLNYLNILKYVNYGEKNGFNHKNFINIDIYISNYALSYIFLD